MKKLIRDEVQQSDYIAIADDKGNKITYKELAEKAADTGRHIEKRSFLFLLCDHQMETLEFIYEVLFLNIVPLLLPEDIDMELFGQLMKVYHPQYIYWKRVNGAGKDCRCVMEFKEHILLKTDAESCAIHPDVALLLSTSGTTGSAKLVKISYENLYDNAAYGCIHLKIQCGQKALSPLPFSYAYGISFCVWNWHCGATVLVTEEPVLSRRFREFYVREKVNNFAATPYTYQILQKLQFWNSETLMSLNFAVSSGAQLAEDEQRSLVSVMKEKFWIGYGQTECIGIVLGTNFKEDGMKMGTVGKAFDNVEVIADSETNEMLIKSKCVCMGYANDREELAEGDVNHGILHTGDVICLDVEGYIYLRGRLKRYVKVLGKRISLDDLVNYLEGKCPCIEFACTGTDDHINIYYVRTEENISEKVRKLLDGNMKIPFKFIDCIELEAMPRNSSGKIAYAKLRELEKENERKNRENM